MDQRAGLMKKLTTVINVYNAFSSMHGRRLVDWANSNPDSMRIVVQVEKMQAEETQQNDLAQFAD